MHVACFGIGQYAMQTRRTSKPFNPILGETYELLCPEFKYFGEQVSHHPPVSAAYACSDSYEFETHSHTKLNV